MPALCGDRFLAFRLELPLDLAPTLNAYASMKGWKRGGLRKRVDALVWEAKTRWPAWEMGVRRDKSAYVDSKTKKIRHRTKVTGGHKRLVQVIRYSSRMPDELSCDVVGGKIPIDRLVQAGILRDDSRKWCERVATWKPAAPKDGRVVVEVWDLTDWIRAGSA